MSGRAILTRLRLRDDRGMTLVELMVTMSILGVVALADLLPD